MLSFLYSPAQTWLHGLQGSKRFKKQRYYFADNSISMVFLVVMYNCESWTIKKADHQKINVFKLWCWRRLLRVPWTARRSNQSILKKISPVYSLEGLMLKLKLQYFATWCEELTHLKRPWFWESLKAWGEGENRGWDGWMASPTRCTRVWASSGCWWWTEKPGVFKSMMLQKVRHDLAMNWTKLINYINQDNLSYC